MTPPSTRKTPRLLLLSVILGGLFIFGAACMGGAKAPVKSANGALAPGAAGGSAKGGGGAFRVVFAGPQGEASEVSELSLVFSRPLRKLELAGAPPPALSVSPPIAGRWLWVGTHALHFVPETARLPGATEYVVTAPAELRALDGATLGTAYQFKFSTPRLKLVDSMPGAGARGLEPNAVFTLHFNQGVDPEKFRGLAQADLRCTLGKTEALGFPAVVPARSDQEPKALLELRPSHPLPIHAQITLAVSETLTGLEGPLAMGAPIDVPVETYGLLMRIDSVNCVIDRHAARAVQSGRLLVARAEQSGAAQRFETRAVDHACCAAALRELDRRIDTGHVFEHRSALSSRPKVHAQREP